MPSRKRPAWRGSLERKPRGARRFYGVLAIAMTLGLALDYTGLNAVKMLFWSAVVNGVLAPPLILLIVLLTSNRKVMGDRVNPPLLQVLGWITFGVMSIAAPSGCSLHDVIKALTPSRAAESNGCSGRAIAIAAHRAIMSARGRGTLMHLSYVLMVACCYQTAAFRTRDLYD